MASGRADYWYGMLPGKSYLGIGQTEWLGWGAVIRGGLGAFLIYTYAVPENYRLNITAGVVSSNKPGIEQFIIEINDVVIWNAFFDQNVNLAFNPAGGHVLVEGDVLECWGNIICAEEGAHFTMTLFGFEEYKIT